MNKNVNKWALNGKLLWLYTKYQIIIKAIEGIIILPGFSWVVSLFIKMSGRTNISSGDYTGFLFSLYGIPVILLGILLLIIILAIDINTFIIISALVQEGRLNIKMKNVLAAALKSVKLFFSPLGILLVIYTALVLPLLQIGISIGPLKNFKIPNFITSVIFNNTLYTTGYGRALAALFVISVIYIFSIHFILLGNTGTAEGFKQSRLLMKKYWKRFIVDYFLKLIKIILLCALVTLAVLAFVFLVDLALSGFIKNDNVSIIVLMLSVLEVIAFFVFLMIPIAISILTKLYYTYNKEEGRTVETNLVKTAQKLKEGELAGRIKLRTKAEIAGLIIIVVTANFLLASTLETNFNEIFHTKVNIEIIAHRGGGDLGAENTIKGIETAAEENAGWTEIDVQRTKDGQYIINHDASFARVAGINKTPMEMTLEEIKQLRVKNEFQPELPPQPVPSFEEILDAARGKIGVFVELKGKSADEKMVDDVVRIIEEKNMLDECVILSLDYKIIEYTHEKHPQIKTGFLYFFSMGKLKDLKGNYLIMEEREASPDKIREIHNAGKKAVVWTVNTPESIERFVTSSVDGIITDHVLLVKEAIEKANSRTHLEIIMDSFTAK